MSAETIEATRSLNRPQLRIATAGSVDDGKSTLIGRLLHDTKTIFEDQLDAVAKASRRYGDQDLNLALLTDGLRAEREQGITIDVAYRYFATPIRSFVLADTPGHVQYTRNMVTGASIADVAIVLIDARHGVVEQTRRHLGVSSMLGVHHLVLAINKMDLVGWGRDIYERIVADVTILLHEIGSTAKLTSIPLSALNGDNVVAPSANADWYAGPPLLELLETVEIDHDDTIVGGRLGVQWVIRSGSDYRGFAGQLVGGHIKLGDEVVALPSMLRSRVTGINRGGNEVADAAPGDAIAISLADHLDIGRGDLLCVASSPTLPSVATEIEADLCWMADQPLRLGERYIAKHVTRQVGAVISEIVHRLDPETLVPQPAPGIGLNDLARVRLQLTEPVALDRYADSRSTGRLTLIDEVTNQTAAALIVRSICR